MSEDDKTRDENKKPRKDKKIIDVLMDDDEWNLRKKIGKKKKGKEEHGKEPRHEQEQTTPHPEPEKFEIETERGADKSGEAEDVGEWGKEQPETKTVSSDTEFGEAEPEKTEDKMGIPQSESTAYMSEIERNVLRAIIVGASSVNDIIRATSYPEVIVKGAIERLVSKDFIDRNLNPTEKIRSVSLKDQGGFAPTRKRKYQFQAIDIAIIVAIILFVIALLFYTGFLS